MTPGRSAPREVVPERDSGPSDGSEGPLRSGDRIPGVRTQPLDGEKSFRVSLRLL